ncbi:hypothetical protein JCM15765_08720 [Paradesulfitobacterium aromaticivorans]
MQHRTCPHCGQTFHSSAQELDWTCPNCGYTIPVKQNGPLTLQSQTDLEKITLDNSIAYSTENIPYHNQIVLDSFSGTVRDFRIYLKAIRRFLWAGVIAP